MYRLGPVRPENLFPPIAGHGPTPRSRASTPPDGLAPVWSWLPPPEKARKELGKGAAGRHSSTFSTATRRHPPRRRFPWSSTRLTAAGPHLRGRSRAGKSQVCGRPAGLGPGLAIPERPTDSNAPSTLSLQKSEANALNRKDFYEFRISQLLQKYFLPVFICSLRPALSPMRTCRPGIARLRAVTSRRGIDSYNPRGGSYVHAIHAERWRCVVAQGFLKTAAGATAGLAAGADSAGASHGAVGGGHSGNLKRDHLAALGDRPLHWKRVPGVERHPAAGGLPQRRELGLQLRLPEGRRLRHNLVLVRRPASELEKPAHSAGIVWSRSFILSPARMLATPPSAPSLATTAASWSSTWRTSTPRQLADGRVRKQVPATNPNTPIIVTGYGDPVTRFSRRRLAVLADGLLADGCSPQWYYYGEWSVYGGVEGRRRRDQLGRRAGRPGLRLELPDVSLAVDLLDLLLERPPAKRRHRDWRELLPELEGPDLLREYSNMNSTIAYYCTH